MPVPMKTPTRSRSAPASAPWEFAIASAAATRASWLTRSSMRSLGAGKCAAASRLTGAAMRVTRRSLYGASTRCTPEWPAASAAMNSRAPLPSGETTPRPVTTTRFMVSPSSRGTFSLSLQGEGRGEGLQVLRQIPQRLHLRLQLRGIRRHRDAERLLDHEEDLDHAQRVDLQALERR